MNDVEILHKCVLKFRQEFKKITGLDQYTRCFTLASIGMEVFKSKFLGNNELAVTPVRGYSSNRSHSKIANCWLDFRQNVNNSVIKREYRIGRIFADGICEQTNCVYEFFGCYYHGCPCTHKENRHKRTIGSVEKGFFSPDNKYFEAQHKIEYYKTQGYKVEFIWVCHFKGQREQDPFLKGYIKDRIKYYNNLAHYGGPIEIREAFFGGRTNNLHFHKQVNDNEEIKYLDFCSLYPYVLKTKKYPIGHPITITENFDYTLKSYFGFVKCIVEPPHGLYLPVLPVRVNGKLMFPLCESCAETRNKSCECESRSIIGTWTTVELLKAIEKGYKIKEIIEVYHYDQSSSTLFRQYINMWLKIKQQASGWPNWCQTEIQKQQYIKDYYEHEGIQLDPEKIEKNEALRYIAKLMLNSFWGTMAQRPNLNKNEVIESNDKFWEIATDLDKEITGDYMVTDDVMMLTWEYKNEEEASVKNYNIAIASFVTGYARLELYNLMDRIEKIRPYSVLYHDTDSVIYSREFNDPEIESGDYLGQLTDEITKDYGVNSKCNAFVSLGPENYGYEVTMPDGEIKSNMKIKGISLNVKALDVITFAKMIDLANSLTGGENNEISVPQRQFVLNAHSQIFTRYFDKVYKAVNDKRVIDSSRTLPYGY